MKFRITAAVLLLAALAAGIWAAGTLQKEYANAQERYAAHTAQLNELDDQAKQLQQTLDALTLDKAQTQQDQADQLVLEAEELAAQMQTLREQIEELKTYLEENHDAISEAQAELTYLQGVYDELEKGLAEVEGYISGN